MEAIDIYKELFFISLIVSSALSIYFVLFTNSCKYTRKDMFFSVVFVTLINKFVVIGLSIEVTQLIEVFVVMLYLKNRVKSDTLLLSVTIYTLSNHYLYILIINVYTISMSYLAALSSVISLFYVSLYFVKNLGRIMTIEKNFKYDILIESNGRKYKYRSYLDTGNFAKEFYTNRPVVFISDKHKVIGIRKCDDYISTANGCKKIELYEVDKFSVRLNGNSKAKKVYLSYISMKFDAIIGLDILN